jgi:hypothetical protein
MCTNMARVGSKYTWLQQYKEVYCTVGMTIIDAFPCSALWVHVSRPKVLVANEVCRSLITTNIPQNRMTIR